MILRRRSPQSLLPAAPRRCLECPMCGAAISAESIAGACAACPLYHIKSGCCIDLIACPECGYHSLPREHDRIAADRSGAGGEAQAHDGTPVPLAGRFDATRVAACSGAVRLSEVPAGSRARLLGFNGIDDNHLGRLTAYGLLPGVHVEVLQRFPAIILGVYQAELAIETKLAEGIWVLPV